MRQVSFICTKPNRFVCRETGDRFAIVPERMGFRLYINECRDVSRPTRRDALRLMEQEARMGLL